MTTPLAVTTPAPDPGLAAAVEAATARIAPTWPLDQFIAVNPLWGFVERPLPEVSARVGALAGSRMLMPRAWYRGEWQAGRLREQHLRRAIERAGATCTVDQLRSLLDAPEPAAPRRALVVDVVDGGRDLAHAMPWCDFVTHATSQFCAAWFDEGQARLGPARGPSFYAAWRRQAERDLGPRLLMGFRGYREAVRALPTDPHATIAGAVEALGIPVAEREAYFTALLLRLNGWAAWCAYRRWQARLAGGDDDALVHLLAIRLAWEWLLFRGHASPELVARWRTAVGQWPAVDGAAGSAQALDWLLQDAVEIAFQQPLCRGLAAAPSPEAGAAPAVQAAFCIDVRSEVFRRALEATSPAVRTLGFAGFFGLPIDYRPLGAPRSRPHLPGLLAPQLRAADAGVPGDLAARRTRRLDVAAAWKDFRSAAVSGFSFVEALGLAYAGKLVGDSLGRTRPVPAPEGAGLTPAEHAARKPRLAGPTTGGALPVEARCDLAAGILRAMSLTSGLARLVLLAGHGSATVNNPHAAGLDCGACCGQTGEVNSRATAALLNDPEVRAGLVARGLAVPADTWFVAGQHNTTTDAVDLYDLDELPPSHRDDLAALRGWLAAAGDRARAERAASLGLAGHDREDLAAAVEARTRDWSQVRPEWALANNAAFVAAPRERTRHLDLAGRSFLHDYRWQDDAGFGILELILTAPVVVAHWINFQYYASTVDNRRFGSGNKVLHNVVGARLGVFEGNGGDLRIGLPLQSLHDGERWMHAPLRLGVFVEAPEAAIEGILAKHATVRQLVENGWIHLFRIEGSTVHARRGERWVAALD